MRICFIAEGSYPYTTGGISSWLEILMKCLLNYELRMFTIGANDDYRGKYIYTIPGNMRQIEEIFLDTPFKKKISWSPKSFFMNNKEKEILIKHFSGQFSDWPAIFEIVNNIKKGKIVDFFNCPDFFEIVLEIYEQHYRNAPFNDFLWSIRTMYINQFSVLKGEIPEADVYHSILAGLSGMVASNAVYFKRKPFILTEHGIYTREREEEIIKSSIIKEYIKELWIKYFNSMSLCAYNFADRIVTQFERNREAQIQLGADSKKTLIIQNGINVDDYDCYFKERLYGDDIVVGAIARIVPIKDIITMVEAYNKARKIVTKLKLVIVGPMGEDKSYNNYVQKYVEKRRIPGIIFTGRIDHSKYMQSLHSMDIFLLTSISEGQPLSILEAMAAGKPIIATDVGSCGELILGGEGKKGEAGIVVPVMDPQGTADAIVRLATDTDLRINMGEIGRQRVREYYTTERMKKSYIKLYNEVLY